MQDNSITRIVHVAEAAGGVERYIDLFVKYYPKPVEHVLILSNNYNILKFEKYKNVKIFTVKMKHNISLKDFKSILQIRKIVNKYKPDLVYCHSTKAGFLGRLAVNYRKIPVYYNAHGWAFNMKCSKFKIFLYQFIERILSKRCKKIICISDYELKTALNHHIAKEDKLIRIYNGIEYDVNLLNQLNKADLCIPSDKILIGQVGRLCKQKGTDIFIDVANELLKKSDKYQFILVGDGDYKKLIVDKIKKYGIEDKIIITGWVDDPLKYINLIDVCCLFSRWEGFGYAIEEYKMFNKPIVASNVDAIPELLDETYDINDIDKLVFAIENYKINHNYKKFTIEECVKKHSILFKEGK